MLALLTLNQSRLPMVGAQQTGITEHVLVMLILAGSGLHSLWRQRKQRRGQKGREH